MEYIDVTIRESFHLNKVTEMKALKFLEYYNNKMLFPEVKAVEFCYLDNKLQGNLMYNESYCRNACEILQGRFYAVAAIHPNLVDISTWNPEVIRLFDTVRLMINTPIDRQCIDIIRYLKELDVKVSLNIIYISKKNDDLLKSYTEIANKENVDYFCLADSNGSCTPEDIIKKIEQLNTINSKIKRNVHLHNHFGMALTNALVCYQKLDLLDCSIHGIGKGGGNLNLENILIAIRNLEKREISQEEIVSYAELLHYFFNNLLEDNRLIDEEYRNLLVGLFNCNLVKKKKIEEESKGMLVKFCELICKE